MNVRNKETPYGFEFGAATITRCFSDENRGYVTMLLATAKHSGENEIQIYVTKTGKVRIFSGHKEWKPET